MPTKDTVFFSYARDDGEFALRLARDLRAGGQDLWLDQLDIAPGSRWDRAVEAALKACGRMLVVLSPASVGSANVMDEVSYALEEGKLLIPVLHRPCEIPFRLRRVQHIDFTEDYGAALDRMLRSLRTPGARREVPAAPPVSTEQPPGLKGEPAPTPLPPPTSRRGRWVAVGVIALIVVAIAGFGLRDRWFGGSGEKAAAGPTARFKADRTTGDAPLDVKFADQSTGKIQAHSWDFGDGGSSDERSPRHRYARPGAYTARLKVAGPGGADVHELKIHVRAAARPEPDSGATETTATPTATYDVVFTTGTLPRSGTDANVFVTLIGAGARTDEIRVNPLIRGNAFESGATERARLKDVPDVGPLRAIAVRHDNSNADPSWRLTKVTVIKDGRTYEAQCDCWLVEGRTLSKVLRF